ncbi:hypothetical protein SAMN05444164_1684 [Bradyrhizobium erythrophlei]|uniref:Uncharacterized protein n=1 Tax=Bradyrhizobium erythrophlei TaxID=1437360 RepID=A0A1H4S051_9BRAD|nr:hypothetical protein SAMN05444164_1684 [Bradyrhizobium erythrophlei]
MYGLWLRAVMPHHAGPPQLAASFCHPARTSSFTRLTNGFSKKLDNHVAAVALYVAHYNLCRVHEALRTTPAKALGVTEKAWTRLLSLLKLRYLWPLRCPLKRLRIGAVSSR